MSKIKLTKGELKRQRDSLKQFEHYLPTLQLKKQQLQMKIGEARKDLEKALAQIEIKEEFLADWRGLLADRELAVLSGDDGNKEELLALKPWVIPESVETETVNIAGANVPVLLGVHFRDTDYDLYATPFWIETGIKELRAYMSLLVERSVIEDRLRILEQEIRITTQRVNLFEKIKIPECRDNIRRIRIYLGDQQANAVGISKVAKGKLELAGV